MPDQPRDDEIVDQIRNTTPRPGDDLQAHVNRLVRPAPAAPGRAVRRWWPVVAVAGLVGATAAVAVSTGVVGHALDQAGLSRGDRNHDDHHHDDRNHDDRNHDDRNHDDRNHDDRDRDSVEPGDDQYQPGYEWDASGKSSSSEPSRPHPVEPVVAGERAAAPATGEGASAQIQSRLTFVQQTDVHITVSRGGRCNMRTRVPLSGSTSVDGRRLGGVASAAVAYRVLVPRVVPFTLVVPRGRIGTVGSMLIVATNPAGRVTRQCVPFRVVKGHLRAGTVVR